MLEFDVLALADGTLVLAHSNDLREVSHGAARGRVRSHTLDGSGKSPPTYRRSTRRWSSAPTSSPRPSLQIDLKRRGIEEGVVEAVRRHGVLERSWVSGFDAAALRTIAAARARPGAVLHAAPGPVRDLEARASRARRPCQPRIHRRVAAAAPARAAPRRERSGGDAALFRRLGGRDRACPRAGRGSLRLDGRRPEGRCAAHRRKRRRDHHERSADLYDVGAMKRYGVLLSLASALLVAAVLASAPAAADEPVTIPVGITIGGIPVVEWHPISP